MFHTELTSPRLETAVPLPVSVDVEVPSCREIERDICPRKRAEKELDITGVINAELNDHDDLRYGRREGGREGESFCQPWMDFQ